jgi:hypothetical protein
MDKRTFVLAALAIAAVACSDDDDPTPAVVIKNDGSVNAPIDAGTGSIDSSVPATNDAATDGSTSTTVKGAPNCFSGTPTTSQQLLNACAEGYLEFDNYKRIPQFNGTLPTIQ